MSEEKANSIVCANKGKYQKVRTATGKVSMNCGDAIATAFTGLTLSQKYALATKVLHVDRKELEDKYHHLNDGMQGMSLANRVRGAINKDAKADEPKDLLGMMNRLAIATQKANAEKAAKEEQAVA